MWLWRAQRQYRSWRIGKYTRAEPPVTIGYWRRSWILGREVPCCSFGKEDTIRGKPTGRHFRELSRRNRDTQRNNPPAGWGRRANGRATPGNLDKSLRCCHSKEEMALQISTLVGARAHQSKNEHLPGEKKIPRGQGHRNEGTREATVQGNPKRV